MAGGRNEAAEESLTVLIEKHMDFLEERIDPDSGLLDKLRANGTLSWKEMSKIKDRSPSHERNAQLLDYVLKSHKGTRLLASLPEAEQTHIANYLIANAEYKSEFGGFWPLRANEISILDTNRESLTDLLELSGLLGLLYATRVINSRQMDSISSKPTSHERAETLLEMLRRRSLNDYKQFIICLHRTKQSHIAEIFDKGGALVRVHVALGGEEVEQTEDEIIRRFKDVMLSKPPAERRRIMADMQIIAAEKGHSVVLYIYCKSLSDLVELREMQTSGKLKAVIERLFNRMLSPLQYSEVTTENLTSVVESIFTQLLHRFHIAHSTVTLSESEYMKGRSLFPADIKMRAVLDFDPKQMSSKEKYELQEIIKRQKRRRTSSDSNEEVMKKNQSDKNHYTDPKAVVLSFKKGNKMETIPPANIGDDVGWWMAMHLVTGQIGFMPRNRVVVDFETEDQPAKTTIVELPLELLDVILQKSYLLYTLSGNHSANKRRRDRCLIKRRDELLINRLSSVDFCWSQRFKKSRFKRRIRRRLKEFYEEFNADVVVVLRNIRSYLEENIIHLKGLIKRLRSIDCLTDVQARLLSRKGKMIESKMIESKMIESEMIESEVIDSEMIEREMIKGIVIKGKMKFFNRNNNPDLLHLMRYFDAMRLNAVNSCLRKRSQTLAARVVANGGAVLKAIILSEDSTKRQVVDLAQHLVQRYNDLRDKTKPRSHRIEKLISQLKTDDIEILNSLPDRRRRTLIVWIWCQSQKAIKTIQKLNESNDLLDIFSRLATSTSSVIAKPLAVWMFKDQFKKSFALNSIDVNFTGRIEVGQDEYVWGVSKLRNEIYILCQSCSTSQHVIRVFNDRNPYCLQRRIDTKEIKFPIDIGSSEKENCLYVIDQGEEKGIWKISREGGDQHEIMKWLTTDYLPRVLSVSSAGHLLIVTWKNGSSKMIIYASDATILHSIQLARDVIHAVETSVGNFIILSKWWKEDEAGPSGSVGKSGCIWSICELTRDGQMVIASSETQELNYSVYLALDADDRVFVADRGNQRVIFFDSNLHWNQILCPAKDEQEKNISQPKILCWDEENMQLIVGDSAIGQGVNVYTVKRKFGHFSRRSAEK